ncbi:MAG: NTP transferase domain-containing protein, partial [Acidimicrobiales bacterium]
MADPEGKRVGRGRLIDAVSAGWSGAVLCGGASRRMGRDKALLVVDGSALAVNVAEALRTAGA